MLTKHVPDRLPTASPDLIASMGKNHLDDQSRIIVRFNGKLDAATLKQAVNLSLFKDPVVGCKFVRSSFRPYWQRCGDIEAVFQFQGVKEQNDSIYDFLLAPLNPFSGPQVRVGLFRSKTDVLYLKMSHLIADGGASFEFLSSLAALYRQLRRNPEYLPKSNVKGCRSAYQVLRHIGPLKVFSSCLQVPMSKSTWNFPDANTGKDKPRLFIRRINPDQLKKIKAFANQSDVTVGYVLITAMYRALFEVLDPPENTPLTMLIPVNLRRYIPTKSSDGICSLTAGYFPQIARRKNEPFNQTLNRIRYAMDKEKAKNGEFGQMFLMELMFAPGYFVPRMLNPFLSTALVMPTFSNFGVVDERRADFGVEVQEILPVGPITHPPEFILGASSFRDELTFTATVSGSAAHKNSVQQFLDLLILDLSNLK